MGWMMGIEPTTTGATIRGSTTELHPPLKQFSTGLSLHHITMARPAGLEPATYGLEGRCSIRLSYERTVYLLTNILLEKNFASATLNRVYVEH